MHKNEKYDDHGTFLQGPGTIIIVPLTFKKTTSTPRARSWQSIRSKSDS